MTTFHTIFIITEHCSFAVFMYLFTLNVPPSWSKEDFFYKYNASNNFFADCFPLCILYCSTLQ